MLYLTPYYLVLFNGISLMWMTHSVKLLQHSPSVPTPAFNATSGSNYLFWVFSHLERFDCL